MHRVTERCSSDDEPTLGLTIARILKGHQVTVVNTAVAALDLIARGHDYDVILSDLMMPGKSGRDFYLELERSSPRHMARVVFVTGGAFTPNAIDFLDTVPNERLAKPFDATVIRATVQRLLESRFLQHDGDSHDLPLANPSREEEGP